MHGWMTWRLIKRVNFASNKDAESGLHSRVQTLPSASLLMKQKDFVKEWFQSQVQEVIFKQNEGIFVFYVKIKVRISI